jgi:exopolysaccharide production protein ExoZ
VPLYWAFTSLYLATTLLRPEALHNSSTDLVYIVKSYAFVPAVHPALGGLWPVYSLGWTLNYEMFFYSVFGAALLVRSPAGRLAVVALVLGGLVLAGLVWRPTDPILQTYSSELLLEFVCGMLIAAANARLMSAASRAAVPMLGVATLWLAAVYSGKLGSGHFVMLGVPAALTVAGLLALERPLRAWPLSLGLSIGDASYSLYLCHPFVQRAFYLMIPTAAAAANPVFGLVCIALASLAAIPCAIVIHRVVEQPVLAWLRQVSAFRVSNVRVAPEIAR